MPDLEEKIAEWRRQLAAGGIKARDVLDELESHLREQIDQLVRSGSDPENAFRLAAAKIGDARELRQEFAKVKSSRFAALRQPEFILNVLAAGFALMGLSGLSFLPLLQVAGWSSNLVGVVCCVSLCAFQLMIGIGLWRRWNFSRYCALAWAAFYLVLSMVLLRPFDGIVGAFAFSRSDSILDLQLGLISLSHGHLALLTRLADFRHVVDFLALMVLFSGIYFLTRERIAGFFRPDIAR